MDLVRVTTDHPVSCAYYFCRAVAYLTFWHGPVEFYQRGIVYIGPERTLDSLKVWLVAVSRKLYAACQPTG